MADLKLTKILRQGSEVWNRWRGQQPEDMQIDLSEARLYGVDLHGADLHNVKLSHTNLRHTNLRYTNLIHAQLVGADLSYANLRCANLCHVNLKGASLSGADLSEADLTDTNLGEANLTGTNLSSTCLRGTNLSKAGVDETIFADVDLRTVKGLAEIQYRGSFHIALHTVQLPQDGSALHFLRGAGLPDEWIDYYRITMMHPIQYHSCFISYAHQDDDLAHRLHSDLQDKGVRCWFAPHDMKIGDKIRPRIDEAIHLQDKLLLILSEDSVASDWVEHEVETALARERRDKRTILFPIRLDNAILESPYTGWAATVQNERHIGDFTDWKDHDQYQTAIDRLLRDLKKAEQE